MSELQGPRLVVLEGDGGGGSARGGGHRARSAAGGVAAWLGLKK